MITPILIKFILKMTKYINLYDQKVDIKQFFVLLEKYLQISSSGRSYTSLNFKICDSISRSEILESRVTAS